MTLTRDIGIISLVIKLTLESNRHKTHAWYVQSCPFHDRSRSFKLSLKDRSF